MSNRTSKPQIRSAHLVQAAGQTFNGRPARQGNGVLLTRHGQTELRAWLDERGHLIIEAPDAERYSLRASDGHLVYNAAPAPTHDFRPADFTTDVDLK